MAVSISPTRFLVTVAAMSATTINTERVDPLSSRRPDPVGVRHGVPQDCRGDGGRREPHYSVTHFLFQPWGLEVCSLCTFSVLISQASSFNQF